MHLHKVIPLGAGLGGGSADAAFTLKLMNEKFNLNLSTEQLINYALQLGSDCPFFIINKPALQPEGVKCWNQFQLDLSAYKFIIVNPGITYQHRQGFCRYQPFPASKIIKRNNSTAY